MEAKYKRMKDALETYETQPKPAKPLIQKVPSVLKDQRKNFSKYFEPRVVSIGPIHHGKFQPMEIEKLRLAQEFVNTSGQETEVLYKEIEKNIDDLRKSYDEELVEKYKNNQDLAWMLFVDGCALLKFLSHLSKGSKAIRMDLSSFAQQDLLLLENQLPYQVLDLLISKCEKNTAQEFEKSISRFILEYLLTTPDDGADVLKLDPKPLHLLDLLRRALLSRGREENKSTPPASSPPVDPPPQQRSEWPVDILSSTSNRQPEANDRHTIQAEADMSNVVSSPTQDTVSRPSETSSHNTRKVKKASTGIGQWLSFENPCLRNFQSFPPRPPTFRNIKELNAAWIDVRPAKSRCLRDIDFKRCCIGKLMLPPIKVDDSTAAMFLNLAAFEMLPGYDNDLGICSYICFMDWLIDHPEDVKQLRKRNILYNVLRSDEEVAKLFNEISTDLVENPDLYYNVKKKIQAHFDMRICTWIAQGYTAHFSSPWTTLAFLGVLTGLILTLLQVLFAK